MPHLLRIDSSARTHDSHSRDLANAVQSHWLAAHPGGQTAQRDLSLNPIESIKNETIIGYYTPEQELTESLRRATALSDTLIAELIQTDVLLLSTPMYNFTVPAVLKAWIDQIMRINKTFGFSKEGDLQGLLKNKTAYITVAIGTQLTGTPLEAMDYLRPYLKTVLSFIGFEQVEFFSIESTAMDEKQMAVNKENTMREITAMFQSAVA